MYAIEWYEDNVSGERMHTGIYMIINERCIVFHGTLLPNKVYCISLYVTYSVVVVQEKASLTARRLDTSDGQEKDI